MEDGLPQRQGNSLESTAAVAGYGPTARLSWKLRWLSLFAGVGVLALLVTAGNLQPARSGLGTHQQLGLPPCSSIVLFGVRCPSCGMTTSWAHFLRGQLVQALAANAGGVVLALIALAYIPASCYFFISGWSSRNGWFSLSLAISLLAAMAIAITQWLLGLL